VATQTVRTVTDSHAFRNRNPLPLNDHIRYIGVKMIFA
jgi:hypothetical protein